MEMKSLGLAPTLKSIVEKNAKIPISSEDIRIICNGKVNIVTYKDLNGLSNFMNLFHKENNYCVCLLYQFPNTDIGHWVSIIYDEDTDQINFFNSYGYNIDYESNSNLLTTLLRMTKKKINVNRVRYQMKDNETATCGIHSAIRCVFHEYNNSEYYKMITSMANGIIGDTNQSNYDKLVSLMAVLPLKYSIPE
jgi:hypothetical protein